MAKVFVDTKRIPSDRDYTPVQILRTQTKLNVALKERGRLAEDHDSTLFTNRAS